MNRIENNNSQTDSSAIDNILAAEQELVPSSGFLASVMERVQQESLTPTPIRFPWKRAVPGIVLATGVFGWAAYEFVREAIPAARSLTLSVTLTTSPVPAALQQPLQQAGWVAMALTVSLVSWLLSRRLAGQSGV